ncbi:MBL fold metallo-hydrolase [Pedobacter panaciterrae]|uniref:MBL fold metallo-hydrolase n=1 Tax=Pedobacter panaciterrae TaxID=363849 RepID=UPI00155DBB5F|nr:MBL fold metallo-hydrolase [Pedobacter panaciterrae]NQX54040.1 MBL fold metallo-hydrolase [Pedobacter panaciterrae]
MELHITHIDTACVLLELNGFRILTDPTLDQAGKLYHHGFGAISRKLSSPGMLREDLGDVDLVLLSHHQHKDNLDIEGRKYLDTTRCILSTVSASRSIPGITGLRVWESYSVEDLRVPGLMITATPARHRPWWVPEFVSGEVIGFIISYRDQKDGVIYIAGDTVFFKGIYEVARRFKIDVGVFNVGGVQFKYLTGGGLYTMDAEGLIKAVQVLQPAKVYPVHSSGWSHFHQKESALKMALRNHADTKDRTCFLMAGLRTRIY